MVKLKPIFEIAKFLLLVVLLAGIFAAIWLRQGEQSLNWAKPFITSRFNGSNSAIDIAVGDVTIDWRDLSTLGLLRVKNVTLSGRDGAVFATLPEMYVGLDLFGFLPQRRALNTILVRQAKLFLTRDRDKVLRLGLQGSDSAVPVEQLLGTGPDSKGKGWDGRLPFRHLMLEHMSFTLSDEATGTRIDSPDAYVRISRTYDRYHADIHLPFVNNGEEGGIDIAMHTPQWRHHQLDAHLSNVPMDYACVFAHCPEGMEMAGKLDAEAQVQFDDEMNPTGGTGSIHSDAFTLTAPSWFPEKLVMKPLMIDLSGTGGAEPSGTLKADIAFEDTHINLEGTLTKKHDGLYLDGTGGLDKLNIDKLYKYWPLGLANDSRSWIIGSISGGYGDKANVEFHLTPKDMASDAISDAALKARVYAHNLTVHYLPGFPDMRNVSGTVDFTGETITANADSGSLLTGTSVPKSWVFFSNLNQPGTPMEVAFDMKAPAADVATFLQLKNFTFDDSLKLDPATLKGEMDGTIKLKFDAFSAEVPGYVPPPPGEVDFSHVIYDIDTQLKDVAQPNFAGSINLSNASGALKANNDGFSFDGAVTGNNATLHVVAKQKSGEDVQLGLDGSIARDQFANLGLPSDNHLGEGSLGIKATLLPTRDTIRFASATLDFTDLAMKIPEIGWSKKRGAAANITVTPTKQAYALKSDLPGLSLGNATLELTPGLGIKRIELPRVKTARSDFGLIYSDGDKGYDITITGNTLDMSDSYQSTTGSGDDLLLKDFPAIRLKADLGAFILDPKAPFTDVQGTLSCTSQRCESADISAQAGKSDIAASITRAGGARQFKLTASDAGDFLRAFDITDRMYGGKLDFSGTYDDKLNPPALPAHLRITDFTLKNSDTLGRILSIGSLSGLANALTGKGIDFSKMTGDFYSRNGLITVNDGRALGNAMGITIGGTLDSVKGKIDMRGTIAPAYALNSVIGNIPVIGYLAGGKEGLFAFNYSVRGPYGDPSVFVNPLSGLTPGFLRGIWGSNQPDNPADEAADEESKDKQPAPAPKQTYPH